MVEKANSQLSTVHCNASVEMDSKDDIASVKNILSNDGVAARKDLLVDRAFALKDLQDNSTSVKNALPEGMTLAQMTVPGSNAFDRKNLLYTNALVKKVPPDGCTFAENGVLNDNAHIKKYLPVGVREMVMPLVPLKVLASRVALAHGIIALHGEADYTKPTCGVATAVLTLKELATRAVKKSETLKLRAWQQYMADALSSNMPGISRLECSGLVEKTNPPLTTIYCNTNVEMDCKEANIDRDITGFLKAEAKSDKSVMELMADIKHVEEIEKELTGLFATADDNNLVHMLKEIDSEMAVTVTALKSIKKQMTVERTQELKDQYAFLALKRKKLEEHSTELQQELANLNISKEAETARHIHKETMKMAGTHNGLKTIKVGNENEAEKKTHRSNKPKKKRPGSNKADLRLPQTIHRDKAQDKQSRTTALPDLDRMHIKRHVKELPPLKDRRWAREPSPRREKKPPKKTADFKNKSHARQILPPIDKKCGEESQLKNNKMCTKGSSELSRKMHKEKSPKLREKGQVRELPPLKEKRHMKELPPVRTNKSAEMRLKYLEQLKAAEIKKAKEMQREREKYMEFLKPEGEKLLPQRPCRVNGPKEMEKPHCKKFDDRSSMKLPPIDAHRPPQVQLTRGSHGDFPLKMKGNNSTMQVAVPVKGRSLSDAALSTTASDQCKDVCRKQRSIDDRKFRVNTNTGVAGPRQTKYKRSTINAVGTCKIWK